MAVPTGVSMPPPTPWTTREITSCSTDCDSPHAIEAAVNNPSAKRKVRLVPMRSPIHPDAGIHTARLTR